MDQAPKPVAILIGAGLTVALLGFGLAFTGTSVRALALFRPEQGAGPAGLPALPGSSHIRKTMLLNGRQAEVSECRTQQPVREVMAHYAAIAAREHPPGIPYLAQSHGAGGSILWVTPQGVHKAVLVSADPAAGGTLYRLVVDRRDEPINQKSSGDSQGLPGGLSDLPGFEVRFTVGRPDGTGTVFLESPGAPRDVAARLVSELEQKGYQTDRARLRAFQSSPAASKNDVHLTIPFTNRARSLAGHMVVAPSPGGARVCVTFRRAS